MIARALIIALTLFWIPNVFGQFYSIYHYAASGGNRAIHVADLNNDGKDDLIAYTSTVIRWYENLGNGSLNYGGSQIANCTTVNSIITADLDNDGDLEIVWAMPNDQTINFAENLGGGAFGPSQIITSTLFEPVEIYAGDLDGDTRPDLVVAFNNGALAKTAWYQNLGGLTFSSQNALSAPTTTVSKCVRVSDVDLDGDLDIIAAQDSIVWFENVNGVFSSEQLINYRKVEHITLGDFNNDGVEDLLFPAPFEDSILILPKYANGTFGSVVSCSSEEAGNLTRAYGCDLDDDGDLDVISLTQYAPAGKLFWNENLGNLTFAPAVFIHTSSPVFDIRCVDIDNDGDMDIIDAKSNSGGVTGGIVLQRNSFYGINSVRGKIFIDLDQNGVLDSTDVGLANVGVYSNPVSDYTFSYADGRYVMDFSDTLGTYTIAPNNVLANWALTTPNSNYSVAVTSSFTTLSDLDFGYTPQNLVDDLNVEFVSGFPRCNDTVRSWIYVENIGTTTPKGIIHLQLDDSLTFYSSNVPFDSIQGQNIYWNFDSLFYFSDTLIEIQTIMPDFNSIGDDLTSDLSVSTFDSFGGVLNTFTNSETETLVCAYDPNDKKVSPKGETIEGFIPNTVEELTYTIRFQNTGNDTARVVRIKDQLDVNLDWQSITPIGSSHPMTIQVEQTGELVFLFDEIMLPDSNVNVAASQGFVRYKVDLRPNLAEGTVIQNSAGIFFDMNPPVTTNTTVNTINTYVELDVELELENGFKVYPNPTSKELFIQTENVSSYTNYYLQMFNLFGQLVLEEKNLKGGIQVIDISMLKPGVYVLSVEDASLQKRLTKRIIVQ